MEFSDDVYVTICFNGRDKSLIFSSYFGFQSCLIDICDLNEYCQKLHYLMIVRELFLRLQSLSVPLSR